MFIEPGITAVPITENYAATKYPDCPGAVTFVVLETPPGDLTITNNVVDNVSGNLVINGS